MKLSALTEEPIIPVPQPRANPANLEPRASPLASAKTTAANFGKRVGLAALSALGSRSAQGRLSIQAITNELVNQFIQYAKGRGYSDQQITDDLLSTYIKDYYGQDALDAVKKTGTEGPGDVMQNAPTVTNGQTNYSQPASGAEAGNQSARSALQRGATRQPQTESYDRWWIMATLSNILQTAQRGTSRLDEVCTTIRVMQRDPQVNSRFPQLNQIATEHHDRLFDLMVYLVENQIKEKPDLLRVCRQFLPEAFNYTRAELWKIFRVLAVYLNDKGLASTTRTDRKGQTRVVGFNANNPEYGGGIGGTARFAGQAQSGSQQQTQDAESPQPTQGQPTRGNTITPDGVHQAATWLNSNNANINTLLNNNIAQGKTDVDQILNDYRQAIGGRPPPPEFTALVLLAAKYSQ